jgi:hypothetical protein
MSRIRLKILGAKSKIKASYTDDPQILSATVRNAVDAVTWLPGFARPLKIVIFNIFDLKIILKFSPTYGVFFCGRFFNQIISV